MAKAKSALRQAKVECITEQAAKKSPKTIFLVKNKGRTPLALPTGQTQQEKQKASDARSRTLAILEDFLQGEDYECSLGQVLCHHNECLSNMPHPAEGLCSARLPYLPCCLWS